MGVSSSESHDLTAFYEMLSASFGVLSQNTGFYPSLDRIIETTLRPLNLGPGGGSYNEPISRLHRSTTRIRTVPMCTSSAWLSCEPCDVRVGVYVVFAYGIKHASMGRYCGDYAQAPRVLV